MILAWIILALVAVFAVINFKKTFIIWMPVQLLFNGQVAIRYESPAMSLVLAVDLMLIVFYFFKIGRKKYDEFNNEPFLLKPIFIFALISYGLSLLLSPIFSLQGITTMIKYFATGFILLAIFQKMIATEEDISRFVKATFIVAFLIISLGIFESGFKDNPVLDYVYYNSPHNETTIGRMWYKPPSINGGLQTRYGMVRASSFFGIHIQFGVACAFMLFFYIVLLQKSWFVVKKTSLFFISILLFSGILIANSKTAYAGVLAFAIGLFSFRQLFNWKLIVPITITIGAFLIWFPQYFLNFSALFDNSSDQAEVGSNLAMRTEQYAVAMKMFMMNPLFGNGLGSIGILKTSNYMFSDILGAESAWMKILPERGLVGGAIYIITFFYLFNILKTDIPKRLIAGYLLGLLIMETATGLFEMTIYIPYLIVLRQMFRWGKQNKEIAKLNS